MYGRFNVCVILCLYNYVHFALYQSCSESVTAVQGAVVGNTGYDEVVAATYTGK